MGTVLKNNDDLWHLYLIRTAKGHLYTGITKSTQKRFEQHQKGKGARYLRGKGPLELVYQMEVGTHSEALVLESKIKKLSKARKESLVNSPGLASSSRLPSIFSD